MGDLPGHPFRGNQWTAGQAAAMERMQAAAHGEHARRGAAMDRMHEAARGAAPAPEPKFTAAPRVRVTSRHTDAEATVAEDYSSGTVMMLNEHLRSGAYDKAVKSGRDLVLDDGGGTTMSARESREAVERLDAAVARGEIEEPTTVFRVMSVHGKFADSLQPGATFRDDGFVSTTKTEDAAREISLEMTGGGGPAVTSPSGRRFSSDILMLRIELPKGTRALDMNAVLKEHKKFNNFDWQHEVLLGRRQTFRVVNRTKNSATLRLEPSR